MFKSGLFKRLIVILLLLVVGFSLAFYASSVPMIRDTVYQLESDSAETILDNVYELVQSEALSIDAYEKSALAAYRRELKDLTLMEESLIQIKFREYENGMIPEGAAQEAALGEIRSLRYGRCDAIWVTDSNGRFLAHPDPRLDQTDGLLLQDAYHRSVMAPLMQLAREKYEGYSLYYFNRQGYDQPVKKLVFIRRFPAWNWVLGAEIYVDAVEEEVERRRVEMVGELRQTLNRIKIARTGYLYIFDSHLNMIIHPNPNIDQTNFSQLLEPITGRPIGRMLIEAARRPDRNLFYKWDKPQDKGNYVYEKISWVRYVEPFDWYIASSVYVDELNTGAVRLRNRILTMALIIALVSLVLAGGMVGRILRPIRRLAQTAARVERGDLSARCEVDTGDEIAALAATFNSMVEQLQGYIEELDQKVRDRTEELETEVRERKKAEQEMRQAHETYRTIFEHAVEGIYQSLPSGRFIKANQAMARMLGYGSSDELVESVDDMSRQLFDDAERWKVFMHLLEREGRVSNFEIQAVRRDGRRIWASISARAVKDDNGEMVRVEGLAEDITERKFSELELQRKATRDAVTGLPNRFLLQTTAEQMLAQARRTDAKVALLYIDLDYFKEVNDTYGHHAGDTLLKQVGQRIKNRLRESDFAARWGGDEFVVLLWDVEQARDIENIAQNIIATLSKPFHLEDGVITSIGASIGGAVYPDHGGDQAGLLMRADRAMYEVKRHGRNGFSLAP